MSAKSKALTPPALIALTDALAVIYWFRHNLQNFVHAACPSSVDLARRVEWEKLPKRQAAAEFVRLLNANKRYSDLTSLCYSIAEFDDFSHLESIRDQPGRADIARKEVRRLAKLVESNKRAEDEVAKTTRRIAIEQARLLAIKNNREKIDDLRTRFNQLATQKAAQSRGIALEVFLSDLFKHYELETKGSFSLAGEQIDGAFLADGTDYIVEAKWTAKKTEPKEIRDFNGKIEGKLENTLGVFISINGYTEEAINYYKGKRSKVLFFDGSDLHFILEERIGFLELLKRKKSHASQTGSVYYPASQAIIDL